MESNNFGDKDTTGTAGGPARLDTPVVTFDFSPPGECPRCGKELKYPPLTPELAEKIAERARRDRMISPCTSVEWFKGFILRVGSEVCTGKEVSMTERDWIEEEVGDWLTETDPDGCIAGDSEQTKLIERLRAAHAAHCEALNDPHSALMECTRIVEEQAQRRINDTRTRWTQEHEINRQLSAEIEKLKSCHPLTDALAERIGKELVRTVEDPEADWDGTAAGIAKFILRVAASGAGEAKGKQERSE